MNGLMVQDLDGILYDTRTPQLEEMDLFLISDIIDQSLMQAAGNASVSVKKIL